MPTSPPNDSDSSRESAPPAPRRPARSAPCRSPRRPWRPPAWPASRRCRRRAAWFPRTPAGRRAASASGRRIRPAASARPSPRGRTPRFRTAGARRFPPDRYRSGARTRARSNRMVSCGSQARCAPAAAFRAMSSSAAGPCGPVDLFRRRRGHRQARALAGRDLDVETIAAGDAAGGVDEHRRQALGLGRGKAHAQRAGFMQMAAAGDAIDLMHVERDRAPGPVGRENRRSRARGIGPHPPTPPTGAHLAGRVKSRYSAIWRLISPGSSLRAIAGIFHGAPVHDREIVAELAGKVEILFDQHDRDVAEAAQIGDRAPDVLDDRGLDALGRLVQQQQFRPHHQRAPDRELLLLAAGQIAAAPAQHRLQHRKQREHVVGNIAVARASAARSRS